MTLRNAFLSTLILGLAGAPVLAQSRAAGRVVRLVSGDTLAVPRAMVVLHEVGRARQGPIDTVRADSQGRFAFRFRADTATAYLLSVRYDGIEYFSPPIASNPTRPDTAVTIMVADTSSTVPVRTRERTLLISRPDQSATRTVVDWFVLRIAGERTRVSPDSQRPSWSAPLPPAAQNVQLADAALSQFSPDALDFRRDSVLVFAPLSPGQKELVLQYRIPGALQRFSVPSDPGMDSVFVLLEEPAARVAVPRLAVTDSQPMDGRAFRRWTGAMAGATSIEIEFPPPALSPTTTLVFLVALAGLGFAGLAVVLLRRRAAFKGSPHPQYLVDAIARLDAEFLDRGELSAEERERYLAERGRLRAALGHALAGPRPHS